MQAADCIIKNMPPEQQLKYMEMKTTNEKLLQVIQNDTLIINIFAFKSLI